MSSTFVKKNDFTLTETTTFSPVTTTPSPIVRDWTWRSVRTAKTHVIAEIAELQARIDEKTIEVAAYDARLAKLEDEGIIDNEA